MTGVPGCQPVPETVISVLLGPVAGCERERARQDLRRRRRRDRLGLGRRRRRRQRPDRQHRDVGLRRRRARGPPDLLGRRRRHERDGRRGDRPGELAGGERRVDAARVADRQQPEAQAEAGREHQPEQGGQGREDPARQVLVLLVLDVGGLQGRRGRQPGARRLLDPGQQRRRARPRGARRPPGPTAAGGRSPGPRRPGGTPNRPGRAGGRSRRGPRPARPRRSGPGPRGRRCGRRATGAGWPSIPGRNASRARATCSIAPSAEAPSAVPTDVAGRS